MGIKTDITRVVHEPLPGYENSADPDMIHGPFGTGGGIPIEPVERFYRIARHFVWGVERKVDMLPNVKREIIKCWFLVLNDRLPSDSEVMYQLDTINLGDSELEYYRKKKEAMIVLAYAFGVEGDEWNLWQFSRSTLAEYPEKNVLNLYHRERKWEGIYRVLCSGSSTTLVHALASVMIFRLECIDGCNVCTLNNADHCPLWACIMAACHGRNG